LPTAQGVHDVASWPPEYVPAMQSVHFPETSLNFPAGQSDAVHELAPTFVDSMPAAQFVQSLAPAFAYEPARQLAHEAEPAEGAAFPATQVTHWVPPTSALKDPAAHMVQSELLPGVGDIEPAVHAVHEVAPEFFWKVPAAHW